ncbi:hypothetical protein TDB9533_01270 [Thalassocella blandensis]|nr:hypothetical protein TDB9533_01270 [Thalassocella blandensis]
MKKLNCKHKWEQLELPLTAIEFIPSDVVDNPGKEPPPQRRRPDKYHK